MRRLTTLLALALAAVALPARAANNIDQLQTLSQHQFRLFSEDMGAALSYKAVTPTEPLGTTGFDLGAELVFVRLHNGTVFDQAVSGNTSDTLVMPRAHVYKGLPLGFDIGAFYSAVPDSNIRNVGAEVRYAILQGSTTTPAVGVRASYSVLQGVSQLDFNTVGVDVSISKGFAFVTPYAGIGEVWVHSMPDASTMLADESFSLNKIFVGVNLNFAVINVAVEGDRTGDTTSYTAKVGWRF